MHWCIKLRNVFFFFNCHFSLNLSRNSKRNTEKKFVKSIHTSFQTLFSLDFAEKWWVDFRKFHTVSKRNSISRKFLKNVVWTEYVLWKLWNLCEINFFNDKSSYWFHEIFSAYCVENQNSNVNVLCYLQKYSVKSTCWIIC